MPLPDPTKMRLTNEGNLLLAGQYVEALGIPTDGLVLNAPLYHPDLSGDTFYSRDDYRHYCTVTGAIWTSQGRTFDGDDYITTPQPLAGLDQYSVCVWFKATGDRNYVLGGTNYTATYGHLYFSVYNGWLRYKWRTSVDASDNLYATGVALDTWYFAVFTRDKIAEHSQLYLKGGGLNKLSEKDSTYYIFDWSGNLLTGIAKDGAVYSNGFEGMVGEVVVYNRILSGTETQDIYLATGWRYQ